MAGVQLLTELANGLRLVAQIALRLPHGESFAGLHATGNGQIETPLIPYWDGRPDEIRHSPIHEG